jgi:hypothetical protein
MTPEEDHAVSESTNQWKYLDRRPGSSYKQLCVKEKKIWAWTLYCETLAKEEPRTPEQLAEDFGIPLDAVREAITYCQSDPPEIREDKRKDDIRAELTGMNEPGYHGKPRPISLEDRVRFGL